MLSREITDSVAPPISKGYKAHQKETGKDHEIDLSWR